MLTEGCSGASVAAAGAAAVAATPEARPAISVVVPVFNEEGNVGPLAGELRAALERMGEPHEIIFVNDGSRDRTLERLSEIAAQDRRLRVLDLDGNFGEAAALSAGFHAARGDLVVTLDGDGQNDPADIPRLVDTLRARGLAAVSGRREERKEGYWLRVFPSRLANALIVLVTGVPVYDCGCGLKVYRRELVARVHLPRGMNRFLPAILGVRAGEVAEVPTRDRARASGASHYGISRTFVVLRDLLALRSLIGGARAAHVRFALGTAAAATAGMLAFPMAPRLGLAFDVLALGCGLVWWNVRRFARAQEAGVYRVRREISQLADAALGEGER